MNVKHTHESILILLAVHAPDLLVGNELVRGRRGIEVEVVQEGVVIVGLIRLINDNVGRNQGAAGGRGRVENARGDERGG